MDLTKTLESLDQMLAAGPKLTPMTKAQFEAYVQDQLAKAKAEADEDDKEAGAKKAKKRLEALRETMTSLSKAEGTPLSGAWTGDNGVALIPEFEHGREDTTRKTEISLTTMATPPPGNQGTQGDGGTAFANAAPSYDQPPQNGKSAGTATPAAGVGTQADGVTAYAGGNLTIGKMIDSIAKALAGVQEPVAKTAPKTPPAEPEYAWPRDLSDDSYLKEGVTKRAPDHWGGDSEVAAK